MNKKLYYIPIIGRFIEEAQEPNSHKLWTKYWVLFENTVAYFLVGVLFGVSDAPIIPTIIIFSAVFLIIGPIEYIMIRKYPQRFSVHPKDEHAITPLNVGRTMYHAFFCLILGVLLFCN